MSEAQTLKTLFHEIGHSILHDKEYERIEGLEGSSMKSRSVKGLEAESVAYVCAKALAKQNYYLLKILMVILNLINI